jgi:hypothetical protein
MLLEQEKALAESELKSQIEGDEEKDGTGDG